MNFVYKLCEQFASFKVVFCEILQIEQHFLKNFFSDFTLSAKKDLLMIIVDSYILYVNQINIFQCSFGLVFSNYTTFCLEIFLWELHINRKK